MRPLVRLVGRALGCFFATPVNYVALGAFYVLVAWLFRTYVATARTASLAPFLEQVSFLLVLVVPVFTMRSLADQLRSGSIDLLYVRGVSPSLVVLAAYLSSVLFALGAVLVPLVLVAFEMNRIASPDIGVLAAQILGVCMIAAVLVAVGTATSSLTHDYLIAALLAEVMGLFLWFMDLAESTPAWARNIFSLRVHMSSFTAGLLHSEDLLFMVMLVGAFLSSAFAALRLHRA